MDQISLIILKYKYLALFPLAAFEGPIIALVVGFFVYLGYLAFIPAYCVLILGDLVPDVIYYYIGRFGHKQKFIEKYGSRFDVISDNFELVEKLWQNHGWKTMFFSKLAYGLSTPFLISAGLVRMPFKRFISYTIPVTLFQYGIIMVLGYYLGSSYIVASKYIEYGAFVIAGLVVVFVLVYIHLSKYARKKLVKMEHE
ncbi:MAG: DedA family protein [Parcubacteria group bacterium]|nr:DedA family protein [Parcubacteria group bacterium]